MLSKSIRLCGPITLLAACGITVAVEPAPDRAGIEFFEKRIRPVLVQSCYECHSARAEEPKGGLRLDRREDLLRGGESGASLVPGKPRDSLLIEALRYESLEMPPKNQLPQEVVADFVKWIEMGAPDPRVGADSTSDRDSWQTILTARRDWWSIQKPIAPPVPAHGSGWANRELDRFVARKLSEAGLSPAPAAQAETLIRRLSLVLTGLPPSWDRVERFRTNFADDNESSYVALVDRLLASPRFGERWARHWMDVVRFSETHGNEWNYEVHHAWRYRDYLIRALNSDVPYDRFVREHIAGDLIPPRWNASEDINESLIGTSFYRFGEVNHDDCVTLTSIGYDLLDNQIDTLSKAFQATTIACARCHHHKIDAVSMHDYYALLGILKSSRLTAHTIDAESVNADTIAQLNELKPLIRDEVVRHWQSQIDEIPRYLLAADAQMREADDASELAEGLDLTRVDKWVEALKAEDPGVADPIHAWRMVTAAAEPARKWKQLAAEHHSPRASDSSGKAQFQEFGPRATDGWCASGQGLRGGVSHSGEFTITHQGTSVIASMLPSGTYTHVASQKLNGTLRSPVIPPNWKFISALVLGDKTSAFRLISNNCQLNYANYRALTSAKPAWVTFAIPKEAQTLNTFAELVTKFDNPKFPDQLGTLGGDNKNDRIPWFEAAADPRSYFGILRAVLHNEPDPPKADLSPLIRLFDSVREVTSRAEIAALYAEAIRSSVAAWADDKASDEDVYWLSWIVEHDLLDHSIDASPQMGQLMAEYRRAEATIQRPRLAAGVADPANSDGYDHPLLLRGDYRQPGERVPRRYLQVLAGAHASEDSYSRGSGRLGLANEIASADNPLTARVIVNRVWHHLFGTGIVPTVDDFGRVGERPSHPELLDHLATRFTRSQSDGGMGWSLKSLIREIVLSQTFRMSSRAGEAGRAIDPENRLLHHYPARRMEAEAIRDSILAVSGALDRAMFGESIQPFREKPSEIRRLFAGPLDGSGRRSLYIKNNLMEGPEFLSSFNFPGGKLAQGRRDVTNVPAQALALLNDRFVLQQAEVWGHRIVARQPEPMRMRIATILAVALGRPGSFAEIEMYERLVGLLAEKHAVPAEEIQSSHVVWKDVAHVMFNLKEFIYIP